MRRLLLVVVLGGLVAVGMVWAGQGKVTKAMLLIVPWDHDGVLQVQVGDVIELWTRPLPLIPENLEASFRAKREGRAVELIGQALPRREGTMQRLFFFKAFEPGPATLSIELVGADGLVKETSTHEVVVNVPCSD